MLKQFVFKHLPKLLFALFFLGFLFSKYVFGFDAFFLTQFAIATFVSILFLVYDEFAGAKTKSGKKKSFWQNALDAVIAVVAALALYGLLALFLQTPTPLNVITSCSMLPGFDRGDLIVLSGGEAKAPELSAPPTALFSFGKSPCQRQYKDGRIENALCTSSVAFQGLKQIPVNYSNDVIVYDSGIQSIGAVIHRVVAKVKSTNGKVYYITKGDNNYLADQEFGIEPATQDKVNGKVILRIPFIGYIKLFMFMQFQEPQFCDSRILEAKQAQMKSIKQ